MKSIILLMLMTELMTGVAFADELPKHNLTPGLAINLTKEQICKTKWGKDKRFVTEVMKKQVFKSYGYPLLDKDKRCPCEIDHLVSRELGGADDVKNLWPQSYRGLNNAHDKDRLENYLHEQICAGNLDLMTVQKEIASDWIAAYKKHFTPAELQK